MGDVMLYEKSGNNIQVGESLSDSGYIDINIYGDKDFKNNSRFNKLMKHRRLVIVVFLLVIILVIALVWYFNSAFYLSQKLINNTWYQHPHVRSDGYRLISNGSIVEFYGDGVSEITWYAEDGSNDMHSYGDERVKWKILKDKTLLFNGVYYEWKDEWSLRGKCLVLNGNTYFADSDFYYSDSN